MVHHDLSYIFVWTVIIQLIKTQDYIIMQSYALADADPQLTRLNANKNKPYYFVLKKCATTCIF